MADFPKPSPTGNHPDYRIDDILEEAKRIKQQRMQQPREDDVTAAPVAEVPLMTVRQAETADKPVQPQRAENTVDSSTRAFPAVVTPAVINHEQDEPVKVYVPGTSVQTSFRPSPVVVEQRLHKGEDSSDKEELEQLQLDSLFDGAEEDAPSEDVDWEERLRLERRQKAENFKLQAPVALRLSGEEEENDPVEEPEEFVEEDIEDFGSYEDTEAIRDELIYRRRTGWIQLVISGLFALSLIGAAVLYWLQGSNINPLLYVSINVFLLGVAALVNHRIISEGMTALFRLQANADSMTSVLLVISMLHTLLQFANPDVIAGDKALVLTPVAAAAMFFSSLGRQMLVLRVVNNFQFVSYSGDKYAAHIIEDRKTAAEIGRAAVALGDPLVCYLEKTEFLSRFLENSYQVDGEDRSMRVYVPGLLGATAIIGIVYGLVGGSVMSGVTVFAATLCLGAPLGAMTAFHYPLLRAAKKVLRHGAMLIGWQAAADFGEVHALAVDALELFPSESVLLHGIKTFSGARIDEAILDAAAVSIAAGGPLSSVFRRVIQNRTDILKEVDTLVYEQDMGMSGWVGGRRVLIGNRRLLENHGVDVPSRDYENRYAISDRQIVYLSTAGELTAMFVISYVADEGIAQALQALCRSKITLLVRTCDPNVTEELICSVYGLDSFYVEVMNAPAGRSYERLLDEQSEENDAVFASNGRLEGTALGVTYCRRLRRSVRLAAVIQVLGGALGLALGLFLALYAGIIPSPLLILAYGVVWTLLSWVVPRLCRV